MLKVWNVSLVLATGVLAILGTFLVRSGILESIHAFGASTLGIPFLILIVRDDRRVDRARREPRGVAALRAPARLAAVARGGVPAQQPRARRAVLRRLLGHVLPAHLRGGRRGGGVGRAAVVQPLHHAARAGPRAAVGDRAADRVAPRDGREPAAQLRAARWARRVVTAVVLVAAGRDRLGAGAADVRVRGVRVRRGRAGAVARRAARGARCRATRSRARWSRSSGATGAATAATSSTSGIAVLFVGVAASSAFQTAAPRGAAAGADRPRRRLHDHLRAADVARGRRRPTGGWSGSTSARGCGCARGDGTPQVLDTYKSYFPSTAPRASARSRASSRARRRARSALRAGLRRDLWAAVGPGHRPPAPADRAGRQGLRGRGGAVRRRSRRVPRPRRCAGSRAPTPTTRRRRRSASSSRRW